MTEEMSIQVSFIYTVNISILTIVCYMYTGEKEATTLIGHLEYHVLKQQNTLFFFIELYY